MLSYFFWSLKKKILSMYRNNNKKNKYSLISKVLQYFLFSFCFWWSICSKITFLHRASLAKKWAFTQPFSSSRCWCWGVLSACRALFSPHPPPPLPAMFICMCIVGLRACRPNKPWSAFQIGPSIPRMIMRRRFRV